MHRVLFSVTELTPTVSELLAAHDVRIYTVVLDQGEELNVTAYAKTKRHADAFITAIRCVDECTWAGN